MSTTFSQQILRSKLLWVVIGKDRKVISVVSSNYN